MLSTIIPSIFWKYWQGTGGTQVIWLAMPNGSDMRRRRHSAQIEGTGEGSRRTSASDQQKTLWQFLGYFWNRHRLHVVLCVCDQMIIGVQRKVFGGSIAASGTKGSVESQRHSRIGSSVVTSRQEYLIYGMQTRRGCLATSQGSPTGSKAANLPKGTMDMFTIRPNLCRTKFSDDFWFHLKIVSSIETWVEYWAKPRRQADTRDTEDEDMFASELVSDGARLFAKSFRINLIVRK